MAQGVRKTITLPGILAPTITERFREFGYSCFSPFGVELACYDVRVNAKHSVTLEVALDTQAAQDAVDRVLAADFRPGAERNGLLVQMVERMRDAATRFRDARSMPAMSVKNERISFPEPIWPLVDHRWQALGYPSLSAYITGLVRYDLMIGGPHIFTSQDCRAEVQDALNRETLTVHQKGRSRKILLDYLIERNQGKPLADDELEEIKSGIAQSLKRLSAS